MEDHSGETVYGVAGERDDSPSDHSEGPKPSRKKQPESSVPCELAGEEVLLSGSKAFNGPHVSSLSQQVIGQRQDSSRCQLLQGLEHADVIHRCDNGPEFTANALRDWCRFQRAGSSYIEPGSPWQNAYVESFGSRIRDELLGVELFSCLTEAQVMIEDWRQDYNHHRPHSSLGMLAPAHYAQTVKLQANINHQLSHTVGLVPE